jgi:hypothetical protein
LKKGDKVYKIETSVEQIGISIDETVTCKHCGAILRHRNLDFV